MLVTFAASALLLAPIPPAQAFKLPSTRECVRARSLALSLRDVAPWESVTLKVDGKRVKQVKRPSPGRAIRLRKLPPRSFTLTVDARASGGRTATVRRKYAGCPQGAPKVTIPATPPPTTLTTQDRIVGTGVRARADKITVVHYALVTWSDGRQIDSSRQYGEPFAFVKDADMVIPGFDQGVTGMRVGGRREVVVPPGLGYGEAGAPPSIAPNETLVFVIDLVAVRD